MAPTPQTIFAAARLFVGGVAFPVLPNATLDLPRGYVSPPSTGNTWRCNYGKSLRQPVVTAQFLVRDVAGEALSTSALLGYALTRSNDAAFDTPVILGGGATAGSWALGEGIVFWDGRTGFHIGGAKMDMIKISSSQGDDIRLICRFVGGPVAYLIADEEAGALQEGTIFPASAVTALQLKQIGGASPLNYTNKQLLRFNNCTFSTTAGAPINGICSFDLTYMNNHTPDPTLNGNLTPNTQNAGLMDVRLQTTAQAADSYAAIDNDNQFSTYGAGRPAPFNINIIGPNAASTCTFSVTNPIDDSEDNRSFTAPRIMRQHSYLGLGVDGSGTGPMVVTSTF